MQLEIPQEKPIGIRFYSVRQHIFRHKKTPRKGLTPSEINRRKQNARLRRTKLANSQEGVEFFNWIFSIMEKLGLNEKQFAKILYVDLQTVRFWRKREGHFPSHKVFARLEELERLLRIKTSNNR